MFLTFVCLLQSIIVVVIARYVASLIHKKGIFEAVIEWKKLPYLEHESKRVGSFLLDLICDTVPCCFPWISLTLSVGIDV